MAGWLTSCCFSWIYERANTSHYTRIIAALSAHPLALHRHEVFTNVHIVPVLHVSTVLYRAARKSITKAANHSALNPLLIRRYSIALGCEARKRQFQARHADDVRSAHRAPVLLHRLQPQHHSWSLSKLYSSRTKINATYRNRDLCDKMQSTRTSFNLTLL